MCIDVVLSLFSSEEKVSRSGRIIKPKKRFIEEVEEENGGEKEKKGINTTPESGAIGLGKGVLRFKI